MLVLNTVWKFLLILTSVASREGPDRVDIFSCRALACRDLIALVVFVLCVFALVRVAVPRLPLAVPIATAAFPCSAA